MPIRHARNRQNDKNKINNSSHNSSFALQRLDEIQVAAGAIDDQRVRIVFVIATIKFTVIHKPKVHALAGFFVNLRGDRDLVSWNDVTVLGMSAGKRDMCEVRRDAKIFFELT